MRQSEVDPQVFDTLVRDVIAIKYVEKQIGRKLTTEEVDGFRPITVWTMDGVKASVYIEKLPLSFFYPKEWSYEESRQTTLTSVR